MLITTWISVGSGVTHFMILLLVRVACVCFCVGFGEDWWDIINNFALFFLLLLIYLSISIWFNLQRGACILDRSNAILVTTGLRSLQYTFFVVAGHCISVRVQRGIVVLNDVHIRLIVPVSQRSRLLLFLNRWCLSLVLRCRSTLATASALWHLRYWWLRKVSLVHFRLLDRCLRSFKWIVTLLGGFLGQRSLLIFVGFDLGSKLDPSLGAWTFRKVTCRRLTPSSNRRISMKFFAWRSFLWPFLNLDSLVDWTINSFIV